MRTGAWGLAIAIMAVAAFGVQPGFAAERSMDTMWGEATGGSDVKAERVALFRDGNYGMFIHWGLYSHLGGQWKGETFYGIGEWILRQMKIPIPEYMALAGEFNPTSFDAREITRIAKAAGMKWIIITAKHHEGFAMFKSAHPFNIVDATPFGRDPMGELVTACRETGLGFGFYYSHYQDWTAPGGAGGPKRNADGSPATFEQYFREKCYPQVKEICTQYGPLDFIWFDTPGDMPKELVLELAELVRTTQPNAMLCSRIGHGLGDYVTKGDMEVPPRNIEGLWESCDTTNDSWSYAWYDQNWKDSSEILRRLVATIGRGGSYLLNVGPDGQGRVATQAVKFLERVGTWIDRHQQVIYGAGASPWGHALPWGDVTTQGNTLNLVVFDWPTDGQLFLPGLQSDILKASIVAGGARLEVPFEQRGTWTKLHVPVAKPVRPSTVIELELKSATDVDGTQGVYPNITTTLLAEFAEVTDAEKKSIHWMEKFGEWKHVTQVGQWKPEGKATWTVNVAEAGDYRLELTYKGQGRCVWAIETDEGEKLQNQQAAASVYHTYPIGLLTFRTPGKHTITVSLLDGERDEASLESVRISPVR